MSASELSQLFSSPIRFDHYMMHALYDPLKGYYASKVSYTEDFITAPTHSEYQARATAGWLIDHEVKRLVEYGPGQGYWAQDIVSNARCKNWVFDKYYMVEPSEALRALQSKALSSPLLSVKAPQRGFIAMLSSQMRYWMRYHVDALGGIKMSYMSGTWSKARFNGCPVMTGRC